MATTKSLRTARAIPSLIVICLVSFPVQARYSGGTGEPNDPYQIATAADLIALGETPADYNKHFILTADIDLDPNLPGLKVFDKAVIAPDMDAVADNHQGTVFTGGLDGKGHRITNLTLKGRSYLGLFGGLGSTAKVSNVALEAIEISGTQKVGGLVGENHGNIAASYCAGSISGSSAGGLAGENHGNIATSYSSAAVSGGNRIGGLVGENLGNITVSYSTGAVDGDDYIGGLVGCSYSGYVGASFWDTQTSGLTRSFGGAGKTTAELQTAKTFLLWGTCGNEGTWTIDEGRDYPRLWWQDRPGEPITVAPSLQGLLAGEGIEQNPYQIHTAEELNLLGLFPCEWDKCFKLMADIDLSGYDGNGSQPAFNMIGDYEWAPSANNAYDLRGIGFTGVFDGNGHAISHLTLRGKSGCTGLFGGLGPGGHIRNLGVIDVYVTCSRDSLGALAGCSNGGMLTNCYTTGTVSGVYWVGGLVGCNDGVVTQCYSTCSVSGAGYVGGLVGLNASWWGDKQATIARCYCNGLVSGGRGVGGLVGGNGGTGTVTQCYSASVVKAAEDYGGLVGSGGGPADVTASFWDTQTSGLTWSSGGTGKTTAEMRTAGTFLDAGWDFVGETANGTEDIWWILEGQSYPRLWWETKWIYD